MVIASSTSLKKIANGIGGVLLFRESKFRFSVDFRSACVAARLKLQFIAQIIRWFLGTAFYGENLERKKSGEAEGSE